MLLKSTPAITFNGHFDNFKKTLYGQNPTFYGTSGWQNFNAGGTAVLPPSTWQDQPTFSHGMDY